MSASGRGYVAEVEQVVIAPKEASVRNFDLDALPTKMTLKGVFFDSGAATIKRESFTALEKAEIRTLHLPPSFGRELGHDLLVVTRPPDVTVILQFEGLGNAASIPSKPLELDPVPILVNRHGTRFQFASGGSQYLQD